MTTKECGAGSIAVMREEAWSCWSSNEVRIGLQF